MKALLYVLIFAIALLLGTCRFSMAQDEIALPRDVAEKSLKALELVPKLENEIVELKKLVKELESQKHTPCSIAIADAERLIVAIPLGEPTDTKGITKARKEQRKLVKTLILNSVKSQCNWQNSPKWYFELLKLSPIAAAIVFK
jgi:hypothetical protein